MIRRWDKSKPPLGPFTLNRDCPQAQGLVAWYPWGGAANKFVPDLRGKVLLDTGTPPVLTLGRQGEPVALFTAASSQYLNTTQQPVSAYPFSVSSWFKPRTIATSVIVGAAETSSTTNYWGMVLISGGTLRAQISSTASAHISETSAVASAGAWQYGVNTYTDSTTNQVYLNTVAGTASDSNSNAFPTPNNFGIASWQRSSSGLYFDGEIGETCIWDRTISVSDTARGYDPGLRFELWYPLRSKKWFSVGTGTPITIDCTLGNAVATGITTTVIQDITINTTIGNVAAAGVTAAIELGSNITIACITGNAVAAGITSLIQQSIVVNTTIGNGIAQSITATITLGDPFHGFTQDQYEFLVSLMTFPTAEDIAIAVVANAETLTVPKFLGLK